MAFNERKAIIHEIETLLVFIWPAIIFRLLLTWLRSGDSDEIARVEFVVISILIPQLLEIIRDSRTKHYAIRSYFNLTIIVFCLWFETFAANTPQLFKQYQNFEELQKQIIQYGRQSLYLITILRCILLFLYSLFHLPSSMKTYALAFYTFTSSYFFGVVYGGFCVFPIVLCFGKFGIGTDDEE